MRYATFGLGLVVGALCGAFGVSIAHDLEREGADHYATGWSVLVRGETLCVDPYLRPRDREIECRSAAAPARR